MMPFLFSSQAISAVGKAASEMVAEVRRQFKEMPGILEGTTKPDYGKAVDISTKSALKGMVVPGLVVLVIPIVVGSPLGSNSSWSTRHRRNFDGSSFGASHEHRRRSMG